MYNKLAHQPFINKDFFILQYQYMIFAGFAFDSEIVQIVIDVVTCMFLFLSDSVLYFEDG